MGTVGYTTPLYDEWEMYGNSNCVGYKTVMPVTGTITKMGVLLSNSGAETYIRLSVFENDSGDRGAMLGRTDYVSNAASSAQSWRVLDVLTNFEVVADTPIWLVCQSSGTTTVIAYDYNDDPVSGAWGNEDAADPPAAEAAWGVGAIARDLGIYAEYSVGSSGIPKHSDYLFRRRTA